MADKQFTARLKSEGSVPKILGLPNGWLMAFAGDRAFAEETQFRAWSLMTRAVRAANDDWDVVSAPDLVHDALLEQWRHGVERDVLRPRFLTLDNYRQADDKTRTEADEAIAAYRQNDTCDLLLCGFFKDVAQIHVVTLDGQAREYDFATIGSGAEVADAMLTWRKTSATDRIARVIYEVYEAKAHAELDPFVGSELDAFILKGNFMPDARDNLRAMSPAMKSFLRSTLFFHDQTPFVRARRTSESQVPAPNVDAPNMDWEAQLDDYLAGVAVEVVKPSSSASEPPSSQSQSGGQP